MDCYQYNYAVLDGFVDDGTILAFWTAGKNRLTAEQRLWKACLAQAIIYATKGCTVQANMGQGFPDREAKHWFRDQSLEPGGWHFVAHALDLSDWQIERIESHVTGAPVDYKFFRLRG